ncbi:integrin beta-7 isoform X2 [Cygnus olor]|uniref:integrin beta-7 isoform X2 n=1 Tax=Cygnus olor TaxID=8869 RepID=UPI001ADE73D3|nr:integrin beta-7 isoform X2 [Cygnus olor]
MRGAGGRCWGQDPHGVQGERCKCWVQVTDVGCWAQGAGWGVHDHRGCWVQVQGAGPRCRVLEGAGCWVHGARCRTQDPGGCFPPHPAQDFTRGGQAEASRCAPREALERAGCPPHAVLEPRGRTRVLEDEELGGAGGGRTQSQLRPQRIALELRPGEERPLEVRFRRAGGLPLDLYYLMDLSYSMRDDLRTLRRLGSDLLAALRNASTSVRIGFGAFVDKPVLPFVSTVPSKLHNPCPERGQPCDPPAAFRHLLSLTADAGEFARRLEGQRISGNLDAPEGGFDAMMQVALCQERIGWRPVTRLLVFASDDAFHTAGDGRLAGIVLPSDSRCHLDASGVYNRSHLYDYPSVGHLAQVLSAANIQPIFAVTRPTVPLYKELSRLIPKSVVGELRDDSSNVVQLITDAYNSLTSTVELQHSPLPPGLSLSFQAHCGGPPEPPQPHRGLCSGVRVNQQVNFTVRVRADACLEAPQHVALRVLGVPEQLHLEVRTLCHCPCAQRAPRAPLCHGGDLDCGVCRCPVGRQGRRCECEGPEAEEEVGGGCRPPNSTAPPCSGRGHCVCGACECPPGLSGRFCECDSSACERHEGLPCGGPQRGACECGRCRCHAGFAGGGCGCSLARGGCRRGGRECSGRGRCECGRCRCQPGFVGPFCARCPSCPGPCQRLRDCVDCGAFGGGPLRGNCSQACNGTVLRVLPPPAPPTPALCREKAADGRILVFLIERGGGEEEDEEEEEDGGDVAVTVWAEEAPPQHPAALAAGLVAGIVAGGLLLAAGGRGWAELRDRREVRRFERERRRARWDENNPLFRSATTTVVNPGYCPQRGDGGAGGPQ